MNRPFGAVDVAANLKGAVPKTATQKILVALAEKGELVQKTYGIHILLDAYIHWLWVLLDHAGKTTFFVANQANLEDMPVEKLRALEDEHKAIEEASKALVIEVKAVNTGRKMAKNSKLDWSSAIADQGYISPFEELAKLRSTPTDQEIETQLSETAASVRIPLARIHYWRIATD
jgi:26S proteasome regulatory subunit, ATPase 3, interacting protein